VQVISPDDGRDHVLSGVAADPNGGATALWASFRHGASPELDAARTTRSGAFGAPEQVAPPGPVSFPAQLAVDPITGRALAVWTSLQGGLPTVRFSLRS
jgi:hypothetical protein